MMNREKTDHEPVPEKDVKEYVGEFDTDRLEETFENLAADPDSEARIYLRTKKKKRVDSDSELIKVHKRITLLSQAYDDGRRIRYKLNSNFEGYEAARQFQPNSTTALSPRKSTFKKVYKTSEEMNLEADERDASGTAFINSEKNIEIRQATQKKWFDGTDPFGAFKPARWKQFGEEVMSQRGIGASLKQKVFDGSLESF